MSQSTDPISPPRWLGVNLIRRRWIFPLAGMVATLLGGAAYAYSVFVTPLEDPVDGIGLAPADATTTFGVALFIVSLSIFAGGVIVDRYGPRAVLTVGALFTVGGMLLSSRIESPIQFTLALGVLFGCGAGLTYTACAVALAARWYPDAAKRGAAIGWSIAGFGAAGVIIGPLWTAGIESIGWRDTFFVTGIIYAVVYAVLLSLVRFPPATWAFTEERGWHPAPAAATTGTAPAPVFEIQPWDLHLGETLRNRYLYILGGIFMLGMFGGLLAIGQLALYAKDHLGVSAAVAGMFVAAFALGNGSGRPLTGWISARLGLRRTMSLVYLVLAVGLGVLAVVELPAVAFPAAVLTGLAFGGSLALTPVMTAMLFGTSYLARNYGFVFVLGFGIGGLAGGIVGSRLVVGLDGNYTVPFVLAGVLALLAAVLAHLLLPAAGMERRHNERTKAALDAWLASLTPAEPEAEIVGR